MAAGVLGLARPGSADAQSSNPHQFSNLSDGKWERQLDAPATENLQPGTALMQQALETYATLPFDIGERMKFAITYLGVKGGVAEVMLRTPVKHKNTWAHRITGEVKSAEWYSWITRVHDAVEGLMGPTADLNPLRFYINQQEGSFRQSKIVEFDEEAGKVRQRKKRKDKDEKSEEFEFQRGTKDALGALYFLRQKLARGEVKGEFKFPVYTSEKTWTGTVTLEKQETKKIDGEKIETDVYRLVTQFGGLMEQKGDIRLWLTRDSRHIPVYVEASVKFGYIKLALTEWDQGHADPNRKRVYEKLRD